MYRNLTVMAAAALVAIGFTSPTIAEETPLIADQMCITNAHVNIVQYKIDVASLRSICDFKADFQDAAHGFIRPVNSIDDLPNSCADDTTLYLCILARPLDPCPPNCGDDL